MQVSENSYRRMSQIRTSLTVAAFGAGSVAAIALFALSRTGFRDLASWVFPVTALVPLSAGVAAGASELVYRGLSTAKPDRTVPPVETKAPSRDAPEVVDEREALTTQALFLHSMGVFARDFPMLPEGDRLYSLSFE